MNHNYLVDNIVIKKLEDYQPWGKVKRWENEDQGYPDCSMGCKYYLKLQGNFGNDWGVCSNIKSHRCGLLTFEHQGCLEFELDKQDNN